MKNYISLLCFVLSVSLPTQARVWIDEASKTVTVLPTNMLTTDLLVAEASEATWAMLSLQWEYDINSFKKEIAAVRSQYPQYQVKRSSSAKAVGAFLVSVAGLKKVSVYPVQNPEGPLFSATIELSRTEYLKLIKSDWRSSIQVEGQVQVEIPMSKVIKEVTITSEDCKDLLNRPAKAADAFVNGASYLNQLAQKDVDLGGGFGNRVLESLLTHCVDLQTNWSAIRIRTVSDLLNTPVKPKDKTGSLRIAETKVVPELVNAPADFILGESQP